MDICIFCKIVLGEIQSVKVYEDAEFLAFLDNGPVSPGHTLLIPKNHFDRFDLTPPELVGRLYQLVRTVAPAIARAMGADGFNASLNNGRAAGQIVFHTHVHIIPRKAKDGLAAWPRLDGPVELDQLGQVIRAALKEASSQ